MTDERDDFDRLLTERLGATEHRVPGANPPPARPSGGTVLRWFVVGTAAVAALVAGIFVSQLMPEAEVADASPTAMPTTPAPTPRVTPQPTPSDVPPSSPPSPTAAPSSAGWQMVPLPIPEAEIGALHFDETLGAWMVIPSIRQLDGRVGPAPVWSSTDGIQWGRTGAVPLDAVRDPSGFVRFGRPIRHGPGLYLFATHTDRSNVSRPLAWTSVDGATWTPFETELPLGEYGTGEVVASSGTVLIAIVGESDGSHAWVSTDAHSWTEVALPGGPYPKGLDGVHGDEDGFVGVGKVLRDEWMSTVWKSPDGVRWTEARSLPISTGAFYLGIDRRGDGTYVAGVNFNGAPPLLLTSVDGLTWSGTEIGGTDSRLADLDFGGRGVAVVSGPGWALSVLTSGPGGVWHEVVPGPSTDGYSEFDVSVGSGTWIAIARQAGSDQPDPEPLAPVLLVGTFER